MLTKIFANFFAHYCFYPSTPSGFPFFLTEVLKKDFCQWRTEWLVLTLKMSSLFFLLFKDSLAWNGSLGWQILILSSWKYYSDLPACILANKKKVCLIAFFVGCFFFLFTLKIFSYALLLYSFLCCLVWICFYLPFVMYLSI